MLWSFLPSPPELVGFCPLTPELVGFCPLTPELVEFYPLTPEPVGFPPSPTIGERGGNAQMRWLHFVLLPLPLCDGGGWVGGGGRGVVRGGWCVGGGAWGVGSYG